MNIEMFNFVMDVKTDVGTNVEMFTKKREGMKLWQKAVFLVVMIVALRVTANIFLKNKKLSLVRGRTD